MICPFCGKNNPTSAPKCQGCGVSFQQEPLVADILPPRKRHISPFIIALSALGIFLMIVLLFILLQR